MIENLYVSLYVYVLFICVCVCVCVCAQTLCVGVRGSGLEVIEDMYPLGSNLQTQQCNRHSTIQPR